MKRGTAAACLGAASAAVVGSVVALSIASCGGPPEYGAPRFVEVNPQKSGFDFIHELPGGALDNLMKAAMGGVALLDYDGDGKIDVFCVNGGWDDRLAGEGAVRPDKLAKSRLYRNLGGMKFEDVTDKSGAGFTGFALGACVGDFDGDGRPDLFVSAYGEPALLRNRGDGTFEDVARGAGIREGFYAGATFLDYDRDGVLDLFASQYVDPDDISFTLFHGSDFAGPGPYKAQPARLYHGRGDGTFEDVTAKAGVGSLGKGMGVLATDVDDDGWIDVYVANDTTPCFLWHNQKDGTFAEAAGRFGLALGSDGDMRAAMGVTAADVDGDGRLDYLVPDTTGGVLHVARGRDYTDRAVDWGLAAASHGFIGWSDVAIDAENDGRIDVWRVQGSLKLLNDQEWSYLAQNHAAKQGGGVEFATDAPSPPDFSPIAVQESLALPYGQILLVGRGGVAADFDDDGLEDLLAVGLQGKARLLRNVTEPHGRFVRVKLVGKKNTMALGARLTGKVGGARVVREVSGASGYLSASDTRLFFGLGDAKSLDDVVVRWPSGVEQSVGSLAADGDRVIQEK